MALLMCVFAVGFSACSSEDDSDTTAKTYEIGDTGPGGGIIFFVDEDDTYPGWKYLEAAPSTSEFSNRAWSNTTDQTIGGAGTVIGTGKENTEAIAAWQNLNDEVGAAPEYCNSLTINGKSDWFMPSQDELTAMYTNLWDGNGWGSFTNDIYYSSTESGNANVKGVTFTNGTSQDVAKAITRRVRPARRF
jgi:hypothetical protein